ncbi:MAG: hypothetical protein KAR33_08625 [Candidatus Thorarchaeota archaeon]|nr:hypothetical protein [Candidatus Thorarchaeota archaeon]
MALLKDKYLIPIGMLCVAFALLIDRFLPVDSVTSFLVGILIGLSITLNVVGLYKARRTL